MTEHKVYMDWTREKAIFILEGKYNKKYLKDLTDVDLHRLGVIEGMWGEFEE